MNILIVEDEALVAHDISQKLSNLGYNDLSFADSVKGALEQINNVRPSVVLVDIELKGDLDGIHLGGKLNEFQIPFIYLSNLQDIRTFERAKATNPSANVPKPVSLLQLRNSLLEIPSEIKGTQKFISITHKGKKYKVERESILFLKASGNNSEIHFRDMKRISSTPMGNVLEKIGDPCFIKVHRSYVVNMKHVNYYEGNMIFLYGLKDPIPMSDKYRNEFINNFDVV
ncbi:MAG: response regulator transcription factor [Flavobacteriales bacterium]|nr:response regulator transcription factor [Flavobacteriales bacterium]